VQRFFGIGQGEVGKSCRIECHLISIRSVGGG
jgi:hypothetical protein